jgi:hypothetical protein
MNNIAVILSGQVRTYKETYNSLFSNILHNRECDFFIHTWDTTGKVIKVHNDYDFSTKINEQEIIDIYKPKKLAIENALEFQSKINIDRFRPKTPFGGTKTESIVSQWYSLNKALSLLNDYIGETGTKYDIVIRARFDSMYNNQVDLTNQIESGSVCIPVQPHYGLIDGYASNDTFGAGHLKEMRIYCSLYNNFDWLMENNIPFHPETMLAWNLNANGVLRKTINLDYTLIR